MNSETGPKGDRGEQGLVGMNGEKVINIYKNCLCKRKINLSFKIKIQGQKGETGDKGNYID